MAELPKKTLEDPVTYSPALKYIYHDLLYSHFGFPPEQFVRSAGDSVNFCLYDATEKLQELLREKYGGKAEEQFQILVEQVKCHASRRLFVGLVDSSLLVVAVDALSRIETLIESRVDAEFDKFEIYVLRNGFRFDLNLLPYFRLEHHPPIPSTTHDSPASLFGEDFKEEEVDVMQELEEEVRLLKEAKEKERKLRELKRVLEMKVQPLEKLKEELEGIKPTKSVKAEKKALLDQLGPLVAYLEEFQKLKGDMTEGTISEIKSSKEVVNEKLGSMLGDGDGMNYVLDG
ncbi:hypothetical protein BT69DRAFT_1315648 [Atractiella rhizophila]|nr:hypothetical protein BT69DRAFT_1315648 [Atractiella rhizophila]